MAGTRAVLDILDLSIVTKPAMQAGFFLTISRFLLHRNRQHRALTAASWDAGRSSSNILVRCMALDFPKAAWSLS
jgi:hypothetical protein